VGLEERGLRPPALVIQDGNRGVAKAVKVVWKDVPARGASPTRSAMCWTACGIPARDLRDCLTFYPFPEMHWRRLRTSNVIERAFREVRRRTDVVGRFPGETVALTLTWATLEKDRLK